MAHAVFTTCVPPSTSGLNSLASPASAVVVQVDVSCVEYVVVCHVMMMVQTHTSVIRHTCKFDLFYNQSAAI